MTNDDLQERQRRIPAGVVLVVMVGAMLLGLLLNAPDILRTAERQEQGWQRTVGIALMEPVASVSRFLFLDRPHRLVDDLLGRGEGLSTAPTSTTTPTASPATTTTSSPTSTVPTNERRPVTEEDPLAMYIGGDSMVGQFGPMLDDRMTRSGLVEAEFVYEFESGLSRPDFLDWPQRLRGVSEEMDPDVFVLYFGGNDAQSIYMPDGSWIDYDTPEWEAEYRRRVDDVMTFLEQEGHWVYWMGMPIVQSETFRPRVRLLNEIYESEAADRPQVTYIDAWAHFQGPDGEYSEYLPDADGNLVDMRLDDGVHYTTAGAIRLAEVVHDVIASDWSLPDS